MNTIPRTAISPLAVAGRLAAASNLTDLPLAEALQERPRLDETLWFTQWQSLQPGSLENFCKALVAELPCQFGPAFLHDESAALTLEQRMELWQTIERVQPERLIPSKVWKDFSLDEWPGPRKPRSIPEQRAFRAALLKIKRETFRDIFLDAAKEQLPDYLHGLCDETKQWTAGAAWYCRHLYDVLLEAMDAHAARRDRQVARTELVSLIFEKLDFARQAKRFIKIEGDSRSGKTEAIQAYAAAWPGRVRLVTVPPGNCIRDLFQAMAEAFGIPFTPETSTRKLKDQVEFVLRHGGLMIIADEAHWLIPAPSSSVATPAPHLGADWRGGFKTERSRLSSPFA